MPGRLRSLLVLLAAALFALPVFSNIVLKPAGGSAQALRVKALAAEVAMESQFAVSRLTYTFANESSSRIEADFLYTLPPGAVATGFAYWFGDEKVIARIVEKERAAAIYQHITSRMRDPALIEMVDERTFRARIFPVMPNDDLRVEIRIVQPLPADPQGAVYTLPLREKGAEPDTLESLNVTVRVQSNPMLTGVTNNYGLPVTRDKQGYRVALTGKNYRPPKDFSVTLRRKAQMLQASLYAARSQARDGYFALALTPGQALKAPAITITGVSVSQLFPAKLPAMKAGRAYTVCGRYRGSGTATVTLSGTGTKGAVSYAQSITFSNTLVRDNLATKLWAARKLAALGDGERNRKTAVALSLQYTLPSKFTSWLAVPKAEMARYNREKTEADIQIIVQQLAPLMVAGTENSPQGKQLQARLQRLCASINSKPEYYLSNVFWDHAATLATRLQAAVVNGQGNTTATQRLRKQFDAVCRKLNYKSEIMLRNQWEYSIGDLARKIIYERQLAKPNRRRLTAAKQQLHRLLSYSGLTVAEDYEMISQYNWMYREDQLQRNRLLTELRKVQPDQARLRRIEARFAEMNTYGSAQYSQLRIDRLKAMVDVEKMDARISEEKDSGKVEELKKERATLQGRYETFRARMGDPLISVQAPADAAQVTALLPGGEIKQLAYNLATHCWEARFDVPVYAKSGDYRITVVIVRRDGTRTTLSLCYVVDLTPPAGKSQARVVTAMEPTVRLEVDGGSDTARAVALLPWHARVELAPAAATHRFFTLAPLPAAYHGKAFTVTFILTDKAHNRTVVKVSVHK